jgi:hypothetical protein
MTKLSYTFHPVTAALKIRRAKPNGLNIYGFWNSTPKRAWRVKKFANTDLCRSVKAVQVMTPEWAFFADQSCPKAPRACNGTVHACSFTSADFIS